MQTYSCPLLTLSDVVPTRLSATSDGQYDVAFAYTATMVEPPNILAERFAEWTYQDEKLMLLRKAYGQVDASLSARGSEGKVDAARTLELLNTQAGKIIDRLNMSMPCQSSSASLAFHAMRRAANDAAMATNDRVAIPVAMKAEAHGYITKTDAGWQFDGALVSNVVFLVRSGPMTYPHFKSETTEVVGR